MINPTAQSGIHPDAESLSLFAEQQLPAPERDQILAHMATCGRCREVVFLAQHAASQDHPTIVADSVPAPTKQRTSWFNGWQWAWLPAVAFAGFVGFAVVQHFRQPAPETQLSAKLSPADNLKKEEPTNALPVSPAPLAQANEELKQLKKAKPSELRDDAAPASKDAKRQLDEKKASDRRELAAGSTDALLADSPGVSGGSARGTLSARAKNSPFGGPAAANQLQQQNLPQQNVAQNAVQESRNNSADVANKPDAVNAAPASASQTAIVEADKVEKSAAPAPATSPQFSSIPLTGQNYEASSAKIAGVSKAKTITLPSRLAALSVASDGARSIALDAAGAMFLSEDAGKHWQPIHTQWTGRPLLVRTLPAVTQAAAMQNSQSILFELVNDKQQTWISYDGKTWTPAPLDGK